MVLDTPKSRRRTFLKTVGTASIVGLAGCSGDGGDGGSDGGDGGSDGGDGGSDGGDGGGGTTGGGSGGDIVIGDAAPLSGNFSPWGTSHRRGLQFAVDEVNNDGGVLGGRNLKLVAQDTEANPQNATTVFRRLVNNEDAVAVTGPVSSDVGISVRSVAEELEVPHLPNQASAPALLTKDTRYTFRVGGTGTPTFSNAAAGVVEDRDYSTYGAIIADYSYGQSYKAGIERYVQPMDGVNSTVKVAPVGASDFSSYLRQMPDGLEFLDAGGHPVGFFSIMQQALELGIDAPVKAGPNLPTRVIYETLGDDITKGVTVFASVDPSADDYAAVGKRYGEQNGAIFDQYNAFGYTTVKLLAAAIEEAGKAEPTAIRDALSGITYDSILSYPEISYTEWGELKKPKLYGIQFTSEAPEYYPDADYGFETFYETEVFDPIDPTEW